MAPFRPANLNKRAYPGNANIIGPTTQATLGVSTTTCFSSTPSCAVCACYPLCLGCRCSFCACPCCNICCSCPCTVCTQTVPSGMWSVSEQYEARTRNAWGSTVTCVTGSATCLCCTGVGFANITNIVDCGGFFICCGPTTNKWFVAPSSTEVSRVWTSCGDAVTVANSTIGVCGWFVPTVSQLLNPGWSCRSYWDSYTVSRYWSSTQFDGGDAVHVCFNNHGFTGNINKTSIYPVRAFRCTAT